MADHLNVTSALENVEPDIGEVRIGASGFCVFGEVSNS